MSKAILVVSFGTSYPETRKRTIDAIEGDIAASFGGYKLYRAWTSKMIMAKLLKRDGIKINNVSEAMLLMAKDGITDVIIQPTHVINGIENDLMKEDALMHKGLFNSITFGNPLLTTEDDNERITAIIAESFSYLKPESEALVLMGHGTSHYANAVYGALNFRFRDIGRPNIFLGTVESYPTLEALIRAVKETGAKKVYLAPFMVVAGDHANNDMAGDDENSWQVRFSEAGFEVECIIKGLGEYPQVRKMFVEHVKQAEQPAINNC